MSLEFFIDITLPVTLWAWVDSVSNRNEYQEYFLEVKADGAYSWHPYHLHVPNVLKSGSFSLLEPTGPVQACNGIALPFRVKRRLNELVPSCVGKTLWKDWGDGKREKKT